MIKHLSAQGKEIPLVASAILNFVEADGNDLIISDKDKLKLHKELSKKIAPALPKTVWLLNKESHTKGWFNFLGPIKLIRRFMMVAIISLIFFIIISCSDLIDLVNISEGIYKLNN